MTELDPKEKGHKLEEERESVVEMPLLLRRDEEGGVDPAEETMPRPCKHRRIRSGPRATFFKPRGVPLRELELVELTLEEFEALRIVDGEETPQERAAIQMKTSQPTLSRILARARKKLASAIATGKGIKIQGNIH